MLDQRGVGLVEVLVALLLLAIAVLGYVALQYKALDATEEGASRVEAVSLARDLAERIRVNRTAFNTYKTQLADPQSQARSETDCDSAKCNQTAMADFDVAQVVTKAQALGMSMNIMKCPNNTNDLQCIYVAWGDTSATNGEGTGDCTHDNAYNNNSTCLIMEAY
ncbi:type IV pilus modification protein PilV [Acinetobacter lanii]|uniref:Type IV pilus modification protein PilV n=1 Tax=Acinetobacter lanii TaxID=2715163 RepID=A0A6G8S7E8_9GAMM|nr:type IV pilus modification protein PilV [Acinetobacter lanii]QIO09978.1 type IV pilus modification protein PilV [Acinetobacter lanii]